jgi:hypothetical protein
MVKLEVAALVPLGVTVAGKAEQVASVGRPLQARETAALNPDAEFTVMATVVEFPATTVAEVGLTETPKSAPPPVSATTCGLLGADSVMVTDAVRRPVAVGVNVTFIVQEAAAARVALQVLVSEKSVLLVPVTAMLMPVMPAVPEFVSVTDCKALVVWRA